MKARRLLEELFIEASTDPRRAEDELNNSQSVFGNRGASATRQSTRATANMQADVDSGRSVARKNESSAEQQAGLRITGDAATLGALQDALHEASASISDDDDLSEWCTQAFKVVANGIKGGTGSVTLPSYKETPGLDSFNDDTGNSPDEEGY